MLEVEMKFANADFVSLRKRLQEWGAQPDPPLQESDQYFNAPDRDFAQTDEALRLRRIGTTNRLTYKGPKRDTQTKTRTEIEVSLAEGDPVAADFSRLLVSLGYRPVRVVTKSRQIFRMERSGFAMEICLDEVAGLGRFAELEIQAPENQLEAARSIVMESARDLGLEKTERRSYLELLLAREATRGETEERSGG